MRHDGGDRAVPHLVAGLIASALFVLGAALVARVGEARVRAGIASLAPLNFVDKWRGEVVQRELFRHDDLLPMYGSSELVVPMPNRAQDFFAAYPTGFEVAPVGDIGTPIVSMAIALASLGDATRGRRVVLSMSGSWFVASRARTDRMTIAARASTLQTGDALLGTAIPRALRERLARRVAAAPEITAGQPLLRATVACLASRCDLEPALPALVPLWRLRSLPLRAQDALLAMRRERAAPPPPPRRRVAVDWARLEAASDSAWRVRSANNRFGIDARFWAHDSAALLARRGTSRDSAFVVEMERAPRWNDLALLLETARALGLRPLVLNTPRKGPFEDFTGVSAAARRRFYARFDAVTAPFGVAARNFAEYDGDPNFLMEPGSHLSEKGWAVYDRTVDAFYHDAPR